MRRAIIPNIRELVPRFKRFMVHNCEGGPLHIWLSDDNIETGHIEFCLQAAIDAENVEAESLARLGLQMSKTQRLKLNRLIYEDLKYCDSRNPCDECRPVIKYPSGGIWRE